jgi:hypothetical protein
MQHGPKFYAIIQNSVLVERTVSPLFQDDPEVVFKPANVISNGGDRSSPAERSGKVFDDCSCPITVNLTTNFHIN